MNHWLSNLKRASLLSILEVSTIVLLAIVPLFLTFPYRINIFLSWEGAYRLSEGQIPFRDFGMPLGYMYWVIPALFFKLFGPQMITLIKAQVFINLLSGFSFRSILKSLSIQPGIRFMSVALYCISFSFFNFWPWYNHTVIVYQMFGLAFLMNYVFIHPKWYLLSISALATFFAFFTKQDGGALALMLSLVLLSFHCLREKKWMSLVVYIASYFVIFSAFILPLTAYNFGYWFNYGQAPHTSRFSAFDIINEFLTGSQWIKFYVFIITLLAVYYFKSCKSFFAQKQMAMFYLLTLGILVEASVFQVTSYTPVDNNIFFHSFAFAFILTLLAKSFNINFSATKPLLIGVCGLLLWWSGVFWKYIYRIAERVMPVSEAVRTNSENIVNKKTYIIKPKTSEIPQSEWQFSKLKTLENIYMPASTVEGVNRLLSNRLVRNNSDLRVLNMTELTSLAVEIPYQLERGPDIPLWFHLGVATFNKEAARYESLISKKHYDLVLFEYIPTLNNFYPFRVRDSLRKNYIQIDSFAAPRAGDTPGIIEVYSRNQDISSGGTPRQ